MTIDRSTVKKVAHLARIAIDDEKVEPLTHELNDIMKWIEQLSEVDTKNVEPLAHAIDRKLPLRQDKVSDVPNSEQVLANAPKKMLDFFSVPKVVE
jgi:aspartyl-tRNA(Asn)/glutamyl-tRNA(Gln) amidotransferase subunit C